MRARSLLSALGCLAVVACGGHSSAVRARAPAPRSAIAAAPRLTPIGAREGSTVALGRLGARNLAFIADEDDGVIHTLDLDRHTELVTTPAGGVPVRVLVAGDGRLLVLLRDRGEVRAFEPGATAEAPLVPRAAAAVAEEPVAMALTPDASTLLVASAWAARLTVLDARSLTMSYEVPLPREPRAVVATRDGKRAFVVHMVGSRMSVVDLEAKTARPIDMAGRETRAPGSETKKRKLPIERKACQSFALAKSIQQEERIFAPEVLVDPGEPGQRTGGYGSAGAPTELPAVAVVDARTEAPLPDSTTVEPPPASRSQQRSRECLLPRAAAIDEPRKQLLVACVGTDDVIAYDASALAPHAAAIHTWHVGAGPTGIAVDAARGKAVVFSQFERSVALIELGGATFEERLTAADHPVLHLALSRRAQPAVAADVALGRRLFHSVGDRRISSDGRACASCHPDGRDDALTWATPEGPRQTPMLAGKLGASAPYGWTGNGADIKAHLKTTFERLGGAGLTEPELEALIGYAGSMAPPSRAARAPSALAVRGKGVFESFEAGCSACHGDGVTPDGRAHDVGSGDGEKFDTPSLRFVSGTAPYFHDGRYATLHELLIDPSGRMGKTAQLSPDDLAALEAYLATL